MIWKSDTGGPMFKYYSPISLGVWIILVFVLFVGLAAAASLPNSGSSRAGSRTSARATWARSSPSAASSPASALAGYTGLVLTGTNRPLWGDTAWITLLFLLSGISAGGAAMVLFGWRQGIPAPCAGSRRWRATAPRWS